MDEREEPLPVAADDRRAIVRDKAQVLPHPWPKRRVP
jgi:hypothetical protein